MDRDFGAFTIHDRIALGGTAAVYRGIQKSLERPVVLKLLYPHLAQDEHLVRRFVNEAKKAAQLHHENIVQVIDSGQFEGELYIAMEFVAGMNLRQCLDQYGAPPLEITLVMLREICRGLEHAHALSVVHRDIKPANLMLTPEGSLKIMDFGLARDTRDLLDLTVPGTVVGTAYYMSPEQASGSAADARSDVFSLGVVAYELLGGQRPFQGMSYETVVKSVLTDEPPPLVNPVVPDSVRAVVLRMLEKDASKRQQSIGEVRRELDRAIEELELFRLKDLLQEYAKDPAGCSEILKKKRAETCLNQALYFMRLGQGKMEDAIREFKSALYLDPTNATASENLLKLEMRQARKESDPVVQTTLPNFLPIDQKLSEEPAVEVDPEPPLPPPPPTPPPVRPGWTRRAWRRMRTPRVAIATLSVVAVATLSILINEIIHSTATVTVVSTVAANAQVDSGSVQRGKTITFKKLSRGPHRMRVWADGYKVQQLDLSLHATRDTTLRLQLEAQLATLKVRVDPVEAFVQIDDLPVQQGRSLIFDGLRDGRHRVRVWNEKFLPQEREVIVEVARELEITFLLQPKRDLASLTVDISPATGTIRVGSMAPKQGSRATFTLLDPGIAHRLVITAPGYEKHQQDVVLAAGRDCTLACELTFARPDTLLLTIKPHADTVHIDGQAVGVFKRDHETRAVAILTPGKHKIRVEHSYFKPIERNLVIAHGSATRLDLSFYDKIPAPRGTLVVSTGEVQGAQIKIQGNEALEATTPFERKLLVGRYTIRVEKSGYKAYVDKEVDVREDQKTTRDLKLTKK